MYCITFHYLRSPKASIVKAKIKKIPIAFNSELKNPYLIEVKVHISIFKTIREAQEYLTSDSWAKVNDLIYVKRYKKPQILKKAS